MVRHFVITVCATAVLGADLLGVATKQERSAELDKTVQAFLERRRGTWQDLNVPESDGRALHNLS